MATVANLGVRISADIKAFEQGMSKVQGRMASVGKDLQRVGATMTRTVTLPLLGIGAAAIKAASDAEEMGAKFDTVFSTVGTSVKRDIDAFADSVGRSTYELRGMAATAGDLFKPLGFTEQAAGDLSVRLTKLAVDLSSFYNMTQDEALSRLTSSLVGNHETARAFSVIINEATLKQELHRIGAEKLTGAALEQAKVQARLNLIIAGTADAQGDAERTSGSFANQMRRLGGELNMLGVEMGNVLLPVATDLVAKLSRITKEFRNLEPETQSNIVKFGGLAAASGLVTWALGGLLTNAKAIFRALLFLGRNLNPTTALLATMGVVALKVARNFDQIRNSLTVTRIALGNLIYDLGNTIKESLAGAMGVLAAAVTGRWEAAWSLLRTNTKTTLEGIISDGEMLLSTQRAMQETPPDPWGIGFITAQAETAVAGIKSDFQSNLVTDEDSADNAVATVKSSLIDLATVKPDLSSVYGMFTGTTNSLSSNADAANAKVAGLGTVMEGLGAADPDMAGFFGKLTGETGSVISNSNLATTAITGIKTSANSLSLLKPTMDANLVVAAFETSEAAAKKSKEETERWKAAYKVDELELSDNPFKEYLDSATPTESQISLLSRYFGVLQTDISDFKTDADEIADAFDDVFFAIDRLGVDEESTGYKAFKWLATASNDLTIFVQGFSGLIKLLDIKTYTNAWESFMKMFESFRSVSTVLVDKFMGLFTKEEGDSPFSGWVSSLTESDSKVKNVLGKLLKWAPAVGAATLALKALGIDVKAVFGSIKDFADKIGTKIKNIFGKSSKEQKKAARLDRFISDVAATGIDLTKSLSSVDKKAIEALMTPILTSGIATSEELLNLLGLDATSLQRTVSDAFQGIQILASGMDVADAGSGFNSAIFGLLNNFAEDIAAEFGMTQLQAEMQMFEFFGVSDRIQEIRDEVARMRANQLARGRDPDGETGVGGLGDPEKSGSAVDALGNLVGLLGRPTAGQVFTTTQGTPNFINNLLSAGASGMGMSMPGVPTSQTINVNLDGQTIASATAQHLSRELEIYGTNF